MKKSILKYFSPFELGLWFSSVVLILLSFLIFDRGSYLSLIASLIGSTSLILCAKGNPIGQVLIIIFSLIYAFISWSFAYYGEVITYLGMSAPMAVVALITWIRNPYKGNRAEVKVNRIKLPEVVFLCFLTALVTFIMYFVLKYFNTSNLLTSTFSVTTSFFAVYLTARRSPFYALAYAFNDIVLIILWILASIEDISYLSVIVCFTMFLVNDLYGFYNWTKMENRQLKESINQNSL